MSDSASKKDVEDVLTSVRRLVSNEMPRKRRADLPKGLGALVLTDAQRIEKPVSKGSAAKSLEDRIAELEVAVSTRSDEYEPDGSEDQTEHRPDRIVYTRPPSSAEEADLRGKSLRLSRLTIVDSAEEDTSEEEATAANDGVFHHAGGEKESAASPETEADVEAPMAEDVADSPAPEAEVRPFNDPDDMIGHLEARMDGGEPQRPGPGHNGFAERLPPYDPDGTQPEWESEAAEEQVEVVEPHGGPTDESATEAESGTEVEDFEAALTEAVTRSVSEAVRVDPSPEEKVADMRSVPEAARASAETIETEAQATPATDAVLDENELRPLVARLIREELQGELGERITRNVRKLVRREILRAINSREFE